MIAFVADATSLHCSFHWYIMFNISPIILDNYS